MSKLFLATSAFCKAALLKDCLKHLYSSPLPSGLIHVIGDNHYPVDKENNRRRIKSLSDEYHCVYLDNKKDLGLHNGLNNIIKEVGIKEDDVFMICDPDDRPSPGSFHAMSTVMQNVPDVAVCTLNFWVIEMHKKENGLQMKEEINHGYRMETHPSVEMWAGVNAINMKLINQIGGLQEPNQYYGGIEGALYGEWRPRNMRLVYLSDYRADVIRLDLENKEFFDQEYRQWKSDHLKSFTGSFEEWLIKKKGS